MTAQLADDEPHGPIWFFTTKDTDLVKQLGQRHRAVAHFAAKGHDLFASIHGDLVAVNDPPFIVRGPAKVEALLTVSEPPVNEMVSLAAMLKLCTVSESLEVMVMVAADAVLMTTSSPLPGTA